VATVTNFGCALDRAGCNLLRLMSRRRFVAARSDFVLEHVKASLFCHLNNCLKNPVVGMLLPDLCPGRGATVYRDLPGRS
jgi:hypothetical protein